MPGTENERKPDPAFVAAWNASKKPYRTLQELEAELAAAQAEVRGLKADLDITHKLLDQVAKLDKEEPTT